MELFHNKDFVTCLIALFLDIFILWFLPQMFGAKPFSMDISDCLRGNDKLKQKKASALLSFL